VHKGPAPEYSNIAIDYRQLPQPAFRKLQLLKYVEKQDRVNMFFVSISKYLWAKRDL